MATAEGAPAGVAELQVEKGLKPGALGLVSSIVMGVASTAPAYSLAATLGSIVAADVLVMASLAQVAGQYLFLLFGAKGIGSDPTSGWVLLVGLAWLAVMTYICYRGIEVSAALQRVLLGVELVMLLVLSVTALVRVGTGNHPAGSITPAWGWFNPLQGGFTGFVTGIILMLFIYWGWDTAVAVNEETKDPAKTPGRAAILSTLILLVTYVIVILSAQSFAC